MRNWVWIKLITLDVLSSPLFGSIGFCRAEALGVRGEGMDVDEQHTVFPFL